VVQLEPGATDPPRPFGPPPAARSAAGEPRSAIRDGWRPAWGMAAARRPAVPGWRSGLPGRTSHRTLSGATAMMWHCCGP